MPSDRRWIPDETEKVLQAGYRHVLAEHTRKKVFVKILRVAGVLT